jgi:glycosyltransferase involved in cell wall biosynthesis
MTGTRSYEFARYLVGKGHRLTMITSGLANREFTVPQGQKYIEVEIDGINVVAIAAGYNNPQVGTAMKSWRRMLEFYQFSKLASRVGRRLSRPDVVLATHTPLTVGLAGISLSRYFSVPFVFEVRDLWPQGLVDLGLMKSPLAVLWLDRMAKKIYTAASRIIALSPGIKEGIVSAGIPAERITVIPNACDLDLFRPDMDGSYWRQRLGLGGRFTAIYFGAMGKANGLEYIIEAARILSKRGQNNIAIVLLGDGGQRAGLEKMTGDYGLTNVIFDGPLPRNEVAGAVASANACITVIRPSKNNTWSPNKMFDALAAGRPILINVRGWLGETVENNNCGRCLDPYQPQSLANALEELSANPKLCQEMSRNARALAEREFDRLKLAACFENVLLEAVKDVVVL